MSRIIITCAAVVATLVLASCQRSAPKTAAPIITPQPTGVQVSDMNRKLDPCDDFDEFANGQWRATNPMPPAKSVWGRRPAAREKNRQQLQEILEEVSAKSSWPSGSVEQLIGDHYASCMDTSKIDSAGLTPISPLLAEIAGARSMADVQRTILRLHEVGIPVAFAFTGEMDNDEPVNFVANIAAGGLGLPDRDQYLKTDAHFVETRTKYRLHIVDVLKLSGMSDAQASKAAQTALGFEKRLAEASFDATKAADPAAITHRVTFAQLEKLAPHVDWAAYFDEAKLPRGDLNVAEPKFLEQVDKELKQTSVADWRAYLTWRLLDSASPALSTPFFEASFKFNDAYLKGSTEKQPRALFCVASTETLFGDALGKKYIERHFSPAAKAKAREIAHSLVAALKEDIGTLPWMEPVTKQRALAKLATYNPQLGYPDKLKDYTGVVIHRDSFWANVAAGRMFNVTENLRQIGKPTDPNFWALAPSSSLAYLDLQRNEIVVPAGSLQAPSFDPDATDAVNYGAMGASLAHDITHSVDTLGSELDPTGRPKNWWTDTDRAALDQRGQCVVDQFEGYFIEPGVHHDGKLVRGESINDLAGLRLAYTALQESIKSHPVSSVDGFTPQQQFFISWAQFRGDTMTLEAQRKLVKADIHPVARFRVIGPLSNMPEFQQAFSCKADSRMVRPPEKRCSVW
jgi:putative endopeptidase